MMSQKTHNNDDNLLIFSENGGENGEREAPLELVFASRSPSSEDRKGVTVRIPGDKGMEVLEFKSLKDLQSSPEMSKISKAIEDDEVFSVDYWVTAFADEPNDQFIRPLPGTLSQMADRFVASDMPPFLNRHDWGDQHGIIVALESGAKGEASVDLLDAKVSARTSELQKKYIRGMLTFYSIGLSATGRQCSVCGAKFKSHNSYGYEYFERACDHQVGQKYAGKTAEVFLTGVKMTELSAVPKPSVRRAKVKSPTFSAADGEKPDDGTQKPAEDRESKMNFEAMYNAMKLEFEAHKSSTEAEIKALREDKEKAEKSAAAEQDVAILFCSRTLVLEGSVLPAKVNDPKFAERCKKMGVSEMYEILGGGKTDLTFSSKTISQPAPEPAPPAPAPAKEYELGSYAKSRVADGTLPNTLDVKGSFGA